MRQLKLNTVCLAQTSEHAHGFTYDLRADSVSGNDSDSFHIKSRVWSPESLKSASQELLLSFDSRLRDSRLLKWNAENRDARASQDFLGGRAEEDFFGRSGAPAHAHHNHWE